MHIRIRSSYYSLLEYCIHKINSIYIYYFSCEYVINVLYKRKPSDLQLIDQPTWNLLFVTLLGVLYKRLQYFILLLRLSTRSNKQTCLLKFLTIYMLFVKHLCSNIFHKMVCYTLKKSWKEFCWFWTIIQHDLSHLVGTLCFYFSRNLLLSFLLWHGLIFWPIQGKGVTFSSLSLPVVIKQTYLFLKNLNVQSFSICWSIWDNLESDPKIFK